MTNKNEIKSKIEKLTGEINVLKSKHDEESQKELIQKEKEKSELESMLKDIENAEKNDTKEKDINLSNPSGKNFGMLNGIFNEEESKGNELYIDKNHMNRKNNIR